MEGSTEKDDETGETREDAPIETGVGDSNPSADSSAGLEGDMGISSGRTGPESGSDSATTGVEGTGTVGSSLGSTDGTVDTTPGPVPEEGRPDEQPEDDEDNTLSTGIDRTVGEDNPAEVPKHEFDPKRNPGHSNG